MASNPLSELLDLPPTDRAELAMALWDSLSEADREGQFTLSESQRAELDRRWADHLANPESSVDWADVCRKLVD